jgi:hypothetical protein
MKIIPLQIIEEVIRTTIDGKEKNYILLFPDNKRKRINLNKIKGKVFDDIDSIQTHMINNATDAINRMASAAVELESIAFNLEKKQSPIKKGVQVETNDDIIMVDLGNGLKGKVNPTTLEKVSNQ